MRIDDELKILAVKTGMTLTEIGRRMDKSPQAFSQKIKRGTFTLDDLQEIRLEAKDDPIYRGRYI